MDWKDMLSQIKNDLPSGEDSEGREEKVENGECPGLKEGSRNVSMGKSDTDTVKREKLSIAMERKGRGGKTATIIFGFTGDDREVAQTATRLKQRLGIGGSARGGEILLQGDVREKVKPLLKEMGFRI